MTNASTTNAPSFADTGAVEVFPRENIQNQYTEFRRRASRTKRLINLAMVMAFLIAPIVLGAVFYYGVAADRYVSEAQVMVRRTAATMPSTDFLSQLTGNTGIGAETQETGILTEFWQSNTIVAALAQQLDLYGMYNRDPSDFLYSLGDDAAADDLADYFRNRFSVQIGESGIVTLRVQAFDPDDAQQIAAAMLDMGIVRINLLNEQVGQSALSFAQGEVDEAEQRVRDAQARLTDFQLREQSIDPGEATSAIGQLVAELEAQLVQSRAELAQLLSYLDEDSATVRGMRATIEALEEQIAIERARMTGSESAMAGMLGEFNRLVLEVELATQGLTSALTSFELAVNEMHRQSVHMLVVSPPHLADQATYPERDTNVALVALASLLVFTIIYLFASAIRDHMF